MIKSRKIGKENPIKGLVIAATKSGGGKTTLTLGLLAALSRRGLKTAPFKVGPDFIDPGHHAAVAGRESHNLDGWMLSKAYNMSGFARHSEGADIAVVEGVMGLFDGYDGKSEAGSTAQMAKWLGLPVLLVVDAKSMARSAAALVQGFERFDPDIDFAGVVFNNLGSSRHLDYLSEATADHVTMPCLGGAMRNERIAIPERHLGLLTREDHALSQDMVEQLADFTEKSIDIDRLLNCLPDNDIRSFMSPIPNSDIGFAFNPGQAFSEKHIGSPKPKIGIAKDRAFCFYYPDNLEILRYFGADLVEFSPISDRSLPDDLDGIYFGGGYPELAAEKLSENADMRRQVLEKSGSGMPIYSECGGFMYLCKDITDTQNRRFAMTGCFPFHIRMHDRLKSLGYREITLCKPSVLGDAGLRARGHEFHYSGIEGDGNTQTDTVFHAAPRKAGGGMTPGYQTRRTLGSYVHLHFGSCPDSENVAKNFVQNCIMYKTERESLK